MTQTYPLTITRNHGWYGVIRALDLYAKMPSGAVKLGNVESGESVQISVPQDATHLYGKMDWGKTIPFDLTFISENETLYANDRFTLNPFRLVGIAALPTKFETTPR